MDVAKSVATARRVGRVADELVPGDADRAAVRRDQGGQDPDDRGLARSGRRSDEHSGARLDLRTCLALIVIEDKPIAVSEGGEQGRTLPLPEQRISLGRALGFGVDRGVGHDAAHAPGAGDQIVLLDRKGARLAAFDPPLVEGRLVHHPAEMKGVELKLASGG